MKLKLSRTNCQISVEAYWIKCPFYENCKTPFVDKQKYCSYFGVNLEPAHKIETERCSECLEKWPNK